MIIIQNKDTGGYNMATAKKHYRKAITIQSPIGTTIKTRRNCKLWDYWTDIISPKLEFIEAWSRNGGSISRLAELLGVPESVMLEAVEVFPELKSIMEEARFICEINIESAIYQAACGYTYTEIKHEEKQNPKTGQVQLLTTKTRKQAPPSMSAATLWLQRYGQNGTMKLDKKHKKLQLKLLELQIKQLEEGENSEDSAVQYQKAFMNAMKEAAKDVWSEKQAGENSED